MATEYGYRRPSGSEVWCHSREGAAVFCQLEGYLLIAREVSEPRIVSIRA